MGLYHYTGGQVKPVPVGAVGGASGLLRYVNGQVVRPRLYRYVGGKVLDLSDATTVVAGFTATPTTGTAPLAVSFTTASATSYVWNFGDGTTSTAQNPVHTYDIGGTYTASLTVTSAAGSGMSSQTITVAAGASALVTSPTRATSPTLTTKG